MIRFAFDAIGTAWKIDIFDALSGSAAKDLEANIRHRIETFDKDYSRFRKDSLVTRMSQHAGTYTLPDDAQAMFDLYQSFYKLTDGAVTPLIGSTLSEAGYDAEYSLKPGVISAPPVWDDAIEYDFPSLTVKKPTLLDVGAAGKGYLVDIISELITNEGVRHFCVDGGGDMVYRTPNTEKLDVGLEHPADPSQAIGIAHLHNQSLCGSSGNRRAWSNGSKTYHHIMNPHTLQSPHHIQALWVVADTGLVADGLATALFFADAATLQKHYTFEYAIIREDFSLEHSANFPATFFTDET